MAPALRRLVLTLGAAGLGAADDCQVDPFDKVDCHIGDQDNCEKANCCWKPISPNPDNQPWCYHKAGTVKTCSLKGSPKAPFSDSEIQQVQQLFEANLDIQGSGMVVAAPDHNTGPGGDYYFAWMRDGALSMNSLLTVKGMTGDTETKLDHWVNWVERSYKQTDPNGDIMTEPKFVIPSGQPFPGGWCRPQTDGPGLRAITLMAYSKAKPSITDRAWASVQHQLDWVSANYTHDGCDLWEEVHSNDFFWNRYTMRKALLQGSDFAKAQGDSQRASTYAAAAKSITDGLQSHVDSEGFVIESVNRKIDTAVVEAFNVGDMGDGLFAPLSKEVVQTLHGLTHAFCNQFELNQKAATSGISGVLYGRYPGDSYDGGNPWILLTASVAELLYRQAEALAKGAKVDTDTAKILAGLLGQDVTADNLVGAGDAIFQRMRTFLTNGMHMNEQIDRSTGELKSAKDLTWNYANVLKAMKARAAALGTVGAETSVVV